MRRYSVRFHRDKVDGAETGMVMSGMIREEI
jgi:hypothetical protein